MPRTYREAGVDIDLQDMAIAALVDRIKFRRSGMGAPLPIKGFYAGLVKLGHWALALSTDQVGTKVMVAQALGRWNNIGVDCVAINVNDVLCVGAEPLAMVDYISAEQYDPAVAAEIGKGFDRGAREARISIVGGEYGCAPEITRGYDISGTCLGVVRTGRVIRGSAIRAGDLILGIPSSGLHCNGFTLARKILKEAGVGYDEDLPGHEGSVGEALLSPTRIYVPQVLRMLRRGGVHGLAHISGSGLWNLPRLKANVRFRIDNPLPVPPILRFLQKLGRIEEREMYQTFNMGMGFAVVAAADAVPSLLRACRDARPVGEVTKGNGVAVPALGLQYLPGT